MIEKIAYKIYHILDEKFRNIDQKHIRRTKNIRLIPDYIHRRGGKLSYAEWAHVIGIFQTIIYQTLDDKMGNNILDIGCGTGLIGISSEPFTHLNGSYTGIDVFKSDIDFCKKHYTSSNYDFIHFNVANPTYASSQNKELREWPVGTNSMELVTALSVWTHLCENDAIYYFKEIARVLRRNGKAIITFFYLDDKYENSMSSRTNELGRFHSTNQMRWIFNENAYKSNNWLTPQWTKNPEEAIGLTKNAIEILIQESGLRLRDYYPGNWKEEPGVFFQDIMIFEK